jgi:hypothetical protein
VRRLAARSTGERSTLTRTLRSLQGLGLSSTFVVCRPVVLFHEMNRFITSHTFDDVPLLPPPYTTARSAVVPVLPAVTRVTTVAPRASGLPNSPSGRSS